FVIAPDFGAPGIGRIGIIPALADVVGRKRAIVVDIGLFVGDWANGKHFTHFEGPPDLLFHAREHAGGKLEPQRVVVGRLRVRDLVRRVVREDHAEVVGLHFAVGSTGLAGGSSRDLRK